MVNGQVCVSYTNLQPGTTYNFMKRPNVGDTNGTTTIASFVASSTSTNCLDSFSFPAYYVLKGIE